MTGAYYNEIDPYAAAWLRELVKRGLIAPGDVDERSIADVRPDDLRGYVQCHFFAGIAGWSLALRLAGWPDDRPVWTGSCPCQPFSVAGKGKGTADERHLWPEFFRLIAERRPAVVFGEQVAGAAGLAWVDHVCADLEGAGYAVAAADLPACSVGAPHRRQRLWWVAAADGGHASAEREQRSGEQRQQPQDGRTCLMADADRAGSLLGQRNGQSQQPEQPAPQRNDADGCGAVHGLAHADSAVAEQSARIGFGPGEAHSRRSCDQPDRRGDASDAWAVLEWLPCSDGKARPTKPGLFPLAHGIPGRVGRLRAYGNAIVSQVAAEFVGAFLEARP